MSDFMNPDIITDLWKEILQRHWIYLETEECLKKLENRKILEGCLKKLVCNVQHDRKFFLEETAKVLKNSVECLENFDAKKGISAFEAISQYANNLFTKPWRKEYHALKLYSGFYQHEIKTNLLDAEILFEAMGYRRISKDILILDEPICPDQVTNVSRDAMIAYVELQIITHIKTALDGFGINCSLIDIYRYREGYIGNTQQAIIDLVNGFVEKANRAKQKIIEDNYDYIDVQPSSNYAGTGARGQSNCQCILQQLHSLSLSATNSAYGNNGYPVQQNYNHSGMSTENGGVQLPQMSHSRSLDHYSETRSNCNNLLPHRHSFDHQPQGCTAHNQFTTSHQQKLQHLQQHHYSQNLNKAPHYESAYDCIDGYSQGGGSSNISYAAVGGNSNVGNPALGIVSCGLGGNFNLNPNSAHAYNVSGNRFPLPPNISNQLFDENSQYKIYNDPQEPAYARITEQTPYPISKPAQNVAYEQINNQSVEKPTLVVDSSRRPRSYQSHQLVNFDDAANMQQLNPCNRSNQNYDTNNPSNDIRTTNRNGGDNFLSALSAHGQEHCGSGHPSTNGDAYVYAKPTPKGNRKPNVFNKSLLYNYNSGEGGNTTDVSYDSAHDVNMTSTVNEHNHQSSKKNQVDVNSVERWINGNQNPEVKCYSKDLDKRKDFLSESLDFDSLNINNESSPSQSCTSEKGKLFQSGNENRIAPQQNQQFESKTKYVTNSKADAVGISSSTNNFEKQKNSLDNNTKRSDKYVQKQNKPASKQHKSNDNKHVPNTGNNNNLTGKSVNGGRQLKGTTSSVANTTSKPSLASNQIILTSANEWSCSFCTFHNIKSKRVCEMCAHSKDFSSSSTSAGAKSLTHNSPTCA